MLARTFRSRGAAVLATVALTGCASAVSVPNDPVASQQRSSITSTGRVYDSQRIRRSGAITAWDAVRLLVPRHRLESMRGASLLFGDGQPTRRTPSVRLILDGHPMIDLEALRVIPAEEVVAIQLLSAVEATQYGGDGGLGAILVQTRVSVSRR